LLLAALPGWCALLRSRLLVLRGGTVLTVIALSLPEGDGNGDSKENGECSGGDTGGFH